MASKIVEDTIEAYLEANWTETQIFTENQENETPVDGSPFIILQFPAGSTTRPIISSRHYREEGAFRIVINLARGAGVTDMRDFGEQLAVLFRDKEIGTVVTYDTDEPFTDDESELGNYFTGAMTVAYARIFTG